MNDELKAVVEDAVREVDVTLNDLPDINLYLDQVLELMDAKRAESSLHFRDRAWTKTMVNNYTKGDLISHDGGKKYDRKQILEMLFIYNMKGVLPMNAIKGIKDEVNKDKPVSADTLAGLYERFLSFKKIQRDATVQNIDTILQTYGLDVEDETDRLLFVLSLASASAYLQGVTEEITRHFYPPAPTPEESSDTPFRRKKRAIKKAFKTTIKNEISRLKKVGKKTDGEDKS